MSTLPPNLVGPILQSHLTQRQAAAVRDIERASAAVDLRQQKTIIDEKGSIVETTDNDTQVYSDAEGTGSQGRPFSEQQQEPDQPADQNPPPDGDEGRNLDIEA
ncbi:MAG TPA: hypothetical protein VLM89_15350 [Phycisphaerae bacterium]|nr:hypothetical protein [Phycisphaerae bacterium]